MKEYRENIQRIADYMRQGEKKERCFKVGVEFEHLIVYADTLKRVSYYGETGVESTLKELLIELNGKAIKEEDHLLGIQWEKGTVTLEPGAQFELSIDAARDLKYIEKSYLAFLQKVVPILKRKDQRLLSIGYQPKGSIQEVDFIPKKRYDFMADYLSKKDKHGLNMMKGTASVQGVIDYIDEEDFIKKFQVANYLIPHFAVLFDNTPVFEGKAVQGNIARAQVWNHVDADRSRVFPGTFDADFGYEKYAAYMMEHPAVVSEMDGKVYQTRNQLIKEVFDGRKMTKSEIAHLVSMFFFDVRVKSYIEIRVCDSVPFPYNISFAALIKGIFYDPKNLDHYYEQAKEATVDQIQEQKLHLIENESIPQTLLQEIAGLLQRAEKGLEEGEKEYLHKLQAFFQQEINFSKKIKENIKNDDPAPFAITDADQIVLNTNK